MRTSVANKWVKELCGEWAYLLVDFRARCLAFDRSLCHGEETRERERRMAGDAEEEKEGDAKVAGDV